jgi:hypothetical protein
LRWSSGAIVDLMRPMKTAFWENAMNTGRRWCCLLLALMTLFCGRATAAERPHIIFVLADDMGLGDVGCYGGTIAPTPNIDRLAKEGTRFTRYYSASPICSPSRCGLLTGQFPARWNVTSFMQTRAGNRACEQVDFLDPKAPSLPRVLKAAPRMATTSGSGRMRVRSRQRVWG